MQLFQSRATHPWNSAQGKNQKGTLDSGNSSVAEHCRSHGETWENMVKHERTALLWVTWFSHHRSYRSSTDELLVQKIKYLTRNDKTTSRSECFECRINKSFHGRVHSEYTPLILSIRRWNEVFTFHGSLDRILSNINVWMTRDMVSIRRLIRTSNYS